MRGALTDIFRYPIKSLGREALEETVLGPATWIEGDRLWAVTHEQSKIVDGTWAKCRNFLRVAHEPALAQVSARLDGDHVDLSHPKAGSIRIAPGEAAAFTALTPWLAQIWPDSLPTPTGLYAYGGSLCDAEEPWISLHNRASHQDIEARAGQSLSIDRWRGNLWVDGFDPWAEFEWIDQVISIGETRLRIMERIDRCKTTHANPETGTRDIDMLAILRSWGHQDFGVYAQVIEGGPIRPGDPVVV